MTTYLSEAFTGSNGSAWNASNWSSAQSTTGASATIQGNRGRLAAGTLGSYAGHRCQKVVGVSQADLDITGTFNWSSGAAGALEIWSRYTDPTWDGITGYFLTFDAESSVMTLAKSVNYAFGSLGTQAFTFSSATDYHFRLQTVGTTIRAKVWTGSEPGSWNISATDSAIAAAGNLYLHVKTGGSSGFTVDFDDVTITNGSGNVWLATGSITPTGTHFKNITKVPFTGNVSTTGVFSKLKVTARTWTGSITPTGVFAKRANKVLTGTISTVGVTLKKMPRVFTGSTTATGTFRKAGQRTFTGAITAVGTLSTTPLGRIFGRPGIVAVRAYAAAKAYIRVRRS